MALLKAPASQAGKRSHCPRCQLALEVPRQSRPAAPGESYAVRPADETDSAELPELVPVTCSICRTHVYAPLDQVGRRLVCPDCGSPMIVPPPSRKIEESPEVIAGYGVNGWGGLETAERESPGEAVAEAEGEASAAPSDDAFAPKKAKVGLETSARPELPAWPFLSGTWTFPFMRGVRAYTFVLAAWALLPWWPAVICVQLLAVANQWNWISSIAFGFIASVLALTWLLAASACGLAIVRDTANGCDEIQDWPSLFSIDWFLDLLYLFNSACVSLLPSIGLAWATTGTDGPEPLSAALGMYILFPIVLFSMLERNTPLGAFSWPVIQTFWRAWRGWFKFFFLTAVLFLAAGGLLMLVLPAEKLLGLEVWRMFAATSILSVVWMIYFRLLGRLGWYCTEHSGRDRPESDDSLGGNAPLDRRSEERMARTRTKEAQKLKRLSDPSFDPWA